MTEADIAYAMSINPEVDFISKPVDTKPPAAETPQESPLLLLNFTP
jgi:hypothetical protein